MATVKAQRVSSGGGEFKKRDLYATVCYYYPQYTLKQAALLKARDLNLLIRTARRLQAIQNLELTQIVAAPHTEKGKGVKKLIERYQREATS